MTSASATIPVGYKQTEVGLMPEDWGIIETKEVGAVQTGPFGAQLHASDYVAWGTPLILIRNMKNGKLSDDGIPYVSDEDASRLYRYSVRAGDLIFSRVGRVGSCVIILPNQEGWLFSGQTLRIRFDTSKVNPHYAAYYFGKAESQRYILKETLGTTRASINTTILSSTPIILPAKGEQDAIAVSISNVDMLIESIENLIAKKRDIKQGTMHKLLTGKTRLPGFSGEWHTRKLFDLVDSTRAIRYGIVQPGDFDQNGRYMIRGQDYSIAKGWASPSEIFKVSEKVEQKYKNARVKTGDLIMTIVGYCGHVEEIPDWLDGANLTQTTARIAIHPSEANNRYCRYALLSEFCQRQVGIFIKGAAQPGLNCGDVEKFLLQMPPTIREQQAIAEVLSDMDAEIAALEQRLEKAKAIKQGMIQQLLTGRIRLVDPSTPVEASA